MTLINNDVQWGHMITTHGDIPVTWWSKFDILYKVSHSHIASGQLKDEKQWAIVANHIRSSSCLTDNVVDVKAFIYNLYIASFSNKY